MTARRRMLIVAVQLAIVAAAVGVWQVLVSSGTTNSFIVGSPGKVIDEIGRWISTGTLWENMTSTLTIFGLGYAIGLVGGTILGLLCGISVTAREYLSPFLAFFNSIPRLILIPFLIVWLGLGPAPKIIIVILVVIFYVALTVESGVREIDRDLILNARALGGVPLDLIRHIYVPAVGGWIIAAARTSIGLAFQAAVVAEFFGASKGLGFLMTQGEGNFDAAEIYAAILVTIVLAVILDGLLALVSARVLRWMPK